MWDIRSARLRQNEFVPAAQAGNLAQANALVKGPLFAAYEQHRAAIDRVVALANTFAGDAEARSNQHLKSSWWVLFGAGGGILVVLVG